jgi:hypothetical protein
LARIRRQHAEERKLSILDRMARRLEADAAEIVDELRAAGRSGDWRATEALLTRVYGKPVERVEAATETLDVRATTPAQRQAAIAAMVEAYPGLAALIPRTTRVSRQP